MTTRKDPPDLTGTNQEETLPERANFYLEEYYATSDPDRHQQLSCDIFREFGIVVEPTDRLPYPNNITTPSDCS